MIIGPLSMEVIAGEEHRQGKHRYLFVLDRELFVNMGRNLALGSFFIFYYLSPDLALRFTPLLASLPLLIGLWVICQVEKELVAEDILQSAPIFNYIKSINGDS